MISSRISQHMKTTQDPGSKHQYRSNTHIIYFVHTIIYTILYFVHTILYFIHLWDASIYNVQTL